MDDAVLHHLVELASRLNAIGIKPVICGGLGVYLRFRDAEGEAKGMIRATNDIDLMLTKRDILEEAKRNAIAEIICGELGYSVCNDKLHFGFIKSSNQGLDVLAPPVDELPIDNYRVKIVKSRLHGHITPEARFIEEDLDTIQVAADSFEGQRELVAEVQVPSATNLLILKLCAFSDRAGGARKDTERAQTHAVDIYITTMLAERKDFQQGLKFLSRHGDSTEIKKALSIVENDFSDINRTGWQHVLGATSFHPDLDLGLKAERLRSARNRLVRWFLPSLASPDS